MDNFKRSPVFGPVRQDDGSFVLAWCQSPETLEPFVDAGSDTGRFVEALERTGQGVKLFGVSDARSGEEFMRVWCEGTGQRGRYERIGVEQLMGKIEDKGFAREVAESRAFNAEFGWLGGEEGVLMPKDVSCTEFCGIRGW